ncbi:transmembrane protein 26b [Amia ocellicauda]|uniref:transmembrane protein 26b n=1 Tax=Amia ocellicauda TaxID=2972642 RepID=UPI003463B16F
MTFFNFVSAVITRFFFILLSLIGVWRVTFVKQDKLYWLLTILYLPLVVEMIFTLKRRKGRDYKWISPAILLFLISIIPSIWILELHHQKNKAKNSECNHLDSIDNIKNVLNRKNETFAKVVNLCDDAWILALHQIMLILLIVGKWLLPIGVGINRDQLSQLLLMFVGIAADILEFTTETLSKVKDGNSLVYIILSVWTLGMLQFPFHVAVVNSSADDSREGQTASFMQQNRSEIWCIVESILIHDGPFLVVRLVVMIVYKVINQMLVFFTIKNLLVVSLQIYRLYVLVHRYRLPLQQQ